MVLLKKITDLRNTFLRKMRKQEEMQRQRGGQSCPFLQLVSLEQLLAIALGLRMNFIR